MNVNSEDANIRWNAVQSVASSATHEELEALVRAAFRAKHNSAKTTAVRAKLGEHGHPLEDEEFKLLAASTLAVILRSKLESYARAATMIGTTHLHGLRAINQTMDIIGLAENARVWAARATRHRPALELDPIQELVVNPTKATESEDQNESLELLAAECTSLINVLAQRQSQFESRALRYIKIQDEELNMLWWLQGKHSDTLDRPFAEIAREQRPFVAAHEIATATYTLPGVASIEALLEQTGVDDAEPVEIAAAIQALPFDWLKDMFPEPDASKISSVTTPLHDAFKRRLEVDGKDTWIPSWGSVCEIDLNAKLSPLRLAYLFYCEQLVILK